MNLLELIIYFTISSILVLTAVNPTFNDSLVLDRKLEVKSLAKELESEITKAIFRNRNSIIQIETISEENFFIITNKQEPENARRIKFPKEMDTIKMNPLKINSRGVVTPRSIKVKFKELTCKIIISLRGRVRSECD